MSPSLVVALITALLGLVTPAPRTDHFSLAFAADQDGEASAIVRAGCARCDWGAAGREAAVLRVAVDDKYSQHLVLTRGEAVAEYRIALGWLKEGRHRLIIDRDRRLSARGAGPATIDNVDVSVHRLDRMPSMAELAPGSAPIIYARPNTVGKFTDVPLVMWCEMVETPRGHQLRYSVIFSNEDGGTKTDRLMATWGRTTDIEYVYGVEIDENRKVLAEEFQGPGHEVPPFNGRHEDGHPLLWVSTDNNMVSASGSTAVRYAPAPVMFDLIDDAREAVMDANPWTYAVASVEMRREGKIAADPPPGIDKIADPRRFVFVEACGAIANAAVSLSIGVRDQWIASDRGLSEYRIARDGCFTIATPLPAGTGPSEIRAIRVHAFDAPPAKGGGAAAPGFVTVTRINKVFMLDQAYLPGPSLLHWEGSAAVPAGGAPFEVKIP